MFIKHLKLFERGFQLSKFLGGVCIQWNKKQKVLFIPENHQKQRKSNCRKVYLHGLLTTVFMVQGFYNFHLFNAENKFTWADKFLWGMVVIFMVTGNLWVRVTRKHESTIILYINGLLGFEKAYLKKSTNTKIPALASMNLFLGYSEYITFIVLPPVFLYGVHFQNICKPAIVGYWILPECYNNAHTDLLAAVVARLLKLFVLATNHWMLAFGLNIAGLVGCGLMILCILSIIECHRSIAQFSASSKEDSPKLTMVIRMLQVLTVIMNEIQQKELVTGLVVAATLAQAFCMTLVVKLLTSGDNLVQIMMFAVVLVDCVMLLTVLLGNMACVNTQSQETHRCMKDFIRSNKLQGRSRRWLEKFWQSFSMNKVRFGSLNYIEKLTPLNCIDYANELTAELLLITR